MALPQHPWTAAAGGMRGAAVRTQRIARRVLHQYRAAGRMAAAGGSGAGVQSGPAWSFPQPAPRVCPVMERQGCEHGGAPPQVPLRALCHELTK